MLVGTVGRVWAWRRGLAAVPLCPALSCGYPGTLQPGCGIVSPPLPQSPGVQAPPRAACRSVPPPETAVVEAAGEAQAESCGL